MVIPHSYVSLPEGTKLVIFGDHGDHHIPSGKRLHNYGQNTMRLMWVNQLFRLGHFQ